MANERSIEDILLEENSLSLSFLAALAAFLRFFWLGFSPHRLEPPYMEGMFSTAMPSSDGPFAKSRDTPSHWKYKEKHFH